MKFSEFLLEEQKKVKAYKPPKRPNKDLLFKDRQLWINDLSTHHYGFELFKTDSNNEYAMDKDKKVIYAIWHNDDNDGIVFVRAIPSTPSINYYK